MCVYIFRDDCRPLTSNPVFCSHNKLFRMFLFDARLAQRQHSKLSFYISRAQPLVAFPFPPPRLLRKFQS